MRPIRECRVPGCGPKPIKGRGLCGLHYLRERTYGDPLVEPVRQPKTCTVEGCDKATAARSYCQMHYLRVRKYGDPHKGERFYATGTCVADGCDKAMDRSRYCVTHRARMDRYGSTELPERSTRHMHTQGYVNVKAQGHPVARRDGWAMEHRVVLFDAIGPGEHACRWCGRTVRWTTGPVVSDSLVVDHLDDDRTNNKLENLAPACLHCNSARASFWGQHMSANSFRLGDLLAVVMDDSERRTA